MNFKSFLRCFGFLKDIPGLPWVADGFMLIHTFFFHRQVIHLIDDIQRQIENLPGVYTSIHKYGGLQFNIDKRELGHIHGNGMTDIRFNKEIKKTIIMAGMAEEHHTLKASGWVSKWLKDKQDHDTILELFKRSYQLWRK